MLPELCRAQSYPPAWTSASAYAVGDQVQEGGNVYRAITKISPLQGASPPVDYSHWQLSQVLSNTTLMIGTGQVFPSLAAAWTYALYARISDGVYLHFYISTSQGSFTENFSAPFLLDHGSGARLAILGDTSSNIHLVFPNTNGFIIDTGHSLNTLSQVTLSNSSNPQQGALTPIGIKADGNATITSIAAVAINQFATCVESLQNSTLTIAGNCQLLNFASTAVTAKFNGSVYIEPGLSVAGNGALSDSIFLLAEDGGQITATLCQITNCNSATLAFGGMIDLSNATISGCTWGAWATGGGVISFQFNNVSSCQIGAQASVRGFIDCFSSAFNSNSLDLGADSAGVIWASQATYTIFSTGNADGSYILT
jgi:hypothetical protein